MKSEPTSRTRDPVTSTNASFPRGILKSADSKKSSRSPLPRVNTDAQEHHDVKKTTFADSERKNRRKQIVNENQARILRYRRWSNPDSTTSSRDKIQGIRTSKVIATSLNNESDYFNPYQFYVDKYNENNALIRDAQKDRMKLDPRTERQKSSLRRGFHSQTSSSHMESMIMEWMHDTSKNRQRYLDFRIRMGFERNIFSAGSLSKASTAFLPSDSGRDVLSRKESFVSKISRRISLFGHQADPHRAYTPRSTTPRVRSFRWYCSVIKAVCSLKLEMQKLSIGKTQQSNLSEILYISAGANAMPNPPSNQDGSENNQFLLFDKSAFSRRRARSRMPLWAQMLMIEPPNRRPSDMVHRLRQLLMNMKSFRENITEDMRHTVCQVVRYTKCDKGRVILRQGHWGFDFYFIFSGSVFIQLELFDERTGQSYPSVENVLKSGEGFGEIALLGDGKRTASVICKEPTELCQIDRETFLEICPALFNELLQDKINFARQFPLFSLWDDDTLKKLCFLSQVLDVPHSTVLETDWAKANFTYFVMKGRINLVKSFDATGIETASSQERSLGHTTGDVTGHTAKVVVTDAEKAKYMKRAKVGTLSTGGCTDLSILSIEPRKDIPHILLLSQGAKVFRVAVRTFFRVSPRKAVEEYLKKVYVPQTFPAEDELRARYHLNLSWAEFRKNVFNTSVIEKSHQDLATIPATMKGSTGWARWPGYHLRPKTNMAPKFGKDRAVTPSVQSLSELDYLIDWEDTSSDDEQEEDEYEESTPAALITSRKSISRPFSGNYKNNEKLVNDRSMTITPPTLRTLTTFKKGLIQPFDAKSV